MLRQLLVCLDSSSISADPQAFAMDYADHYAGAVVSCIYLHTLPAGALAAGGEDPDRSLQVQQQVVDGFRSMPHSRDVTVRGVMRGRDCTGEIAELAHTTDLIVMAAEATGLLSTVIPELVRVIPRPFLFTAGSRRLRSPILVAHDGSWASDRALRCAADIAVSWRPEALEVAILGVTSGPSGSVAHLDAAAHYLKAYGISAQIMCAPGVPAESIGRVAADIDAGLVCMGAFGHTALREFLLGSTTFDVFTRSRTPVLLAH